MQTAKPHITVIYKEVHKSEDNLVKAVKIGVSLFKHKITTLVLK